MALFLYAAANVVVLSFVPAALFAGERHGSGAPGYPRLRAPWLVAMARSRAGRALGAVLGLAAVVAAGLSGAGLLWAVAGFAVAGNLWTLLNPWAAVHDLVWRPGWRGPRFALPERLGAWPAVAAAAGLAGAELVPAPLRSPQVVLPLAASYSALTLAGMALFGRDEWLSRCEGLTTLFGVVGRLGPVETASGADGRLEQVWLRPWGAGLLDRQRPGWDRVVLVVLLLSALALTGLLGTAPWQALAGAVPMGSLTAAIVGLLLLTAAILGVFAAFARLMLTLAGGAADDLAAITGFALTLVPVALMYDAALAAGLVLGQAQAVLPSWALARPDAVWYLQVTLVVIGHAVAVHLAHRHAGAQFRTARRALLAQYPMVVLLVISTMTSMWILAQPLV
ncbi:MAG TPA: hypothetical protein VGO86_14350 [Candidatus Dormibacteraeota bacterium]